MTYSKGEMVHWHNHGSGPDRVYHTHVGGAIWHDHKPLFPGYYRHAKNTQNPSKQLKATGHDKRAAERFMKRQKAAMKACGATEADADKGARDIAAMYNHHFRKWANPTEPVAIAHSSKHKLYESFHGNPPERYRKVNLPTPPKGSKLMVIGVLKRLEYCPTKNSKHHGVQFYHDSGDTGNGTVKVETLLVTDEQGKNIYILPQHPKYPNFSNRGIIG